MLTNLAIRNSWHSRGTVKANTNWVGSIYMEKVWLKIILKQFIGVKKLLNRGIVRLNIYWGWCIKEKQILIKTLLRRLNFYHSIEQLPKSVRWFDYNKYCLHFMVSIEGRLHSIYIFYRYSNLAPWLICITPSSIYSG